MSNEFYEYIALTLLTYFQSQADAISPGSRYCLKLDTPDLVENVYNSLSSALEKKSIKGSFDYNGVYQTYTLRLKENKELVIAAKVGGITDDFFTSLRNNDLTENRFPILIITHSTIDSIASGTADLSAKGMPFHAQTLIKGLSKDIQETPFSLYDKTLLETQLNEHASDRFSEKSSLLVYSDVISLVNKGRIEQDDYYTLGYFPDENAYKYNKNDIKDNLKGNRKYFELIDRAVKFKNFSQMEELFNPKFIQRIQKSLDKQEHWYNGVTIQDIQEAKLRQKETIEITPDDVDVFFDIEIDRLIRNEDFFVKTDGATKAQSRKLNILIFNPEAKEQLNVEVNLKKKGQLKKSDVVGQGLDVSVGSRTIKATIQPNGVEFGSIIIKDPGNGKRSYQIKIAVLNIDKNILRDIRTTFSIGFSSRNIKKSKVILTGVFETLTLNSAATTIPKETLEDGATYNVSKDQGVLLQVEDSSFNPNTGSAVFTLRIGSLSLPMELKSEKSRPNVLTGLKAFLFKHTKQESIEYAENRLINGTGAYIPFDDFKQSLEIENFIVKNGYFAIKEGINGLENNELELPESVKQQYHNLIEELRKAKTLPSLSYLKGSLKVAAEAYVTAVYSTLEQIKEGQTLSNELNNLLCIGSVITRQGLRLSPLHPLNVAYQLELLKEEGLGELKEYMVEKLSCINLLPYVRPFSDNLCHAVYHSHSPEWLDYIPISEKSFSGGKNFVPKLVKKKITDYLENFKFLFDDVSNPLIKLNLVGMGDCADVLSGITKYYIQEIADGTAPEDLKSFEINIYEEGIGFNQFSILSSPRKLKAYIRSIVPKAELRNEMYTILTSHIHCFFHSIEEKQYAYAHICFYEMPNSEQNGYSRMDNINTGISLNGLVSGVPSVLDQAWHKTGFGTKYARENRLTKFAMLLNAAQKVAFTGSSFNSGEAIFTQISQNNQGNLEKLYQTSNWVVFVSPKVDLSYFYKGHSKDLMIIHYSDQFSSASGYDDITVTDKSGQYKEIIKEKFSQKGIKNIDGDRITQLIRFFNSINGEWLLKLIASNAPHNNFSREKMSILSAIKLLMNYFSHPDILWVPLSLEELLRVSRGAGYHESEGLLSARNLGFQNGPTCDDLLMVGFYVQNGKVKLCLHPVEVKIGENAESVLNKAEKQSQSTYTGLMNALNPPENKDSLEHRLLRNFFAQQLIASCEKLNIYSSLPGQSWKDILDIYRTQLLNDEYEISTSLETVIGKATVVSFKFNAEKHLLDEGAIKQITIPEERGFKLLVQDDSEIKAYLEEVEDAFIFPLADCKLSDLPEVSDIQFENSDSDKTNSQESGQKPDDRTDGDDGEDGNVEKVPEGKEEGEEAAENDKPAGVISNTPRSMRIRFGTDIATGNPVDWYPNDTEMVFHTNTGIIGTMGTGKTQFTKSLVSQLIDNQSDNFTGDPLGILIFDYKGDYNEGKKDFFNATKAKIFKPYHLPFNPFSLIRGKVTKPLLPKHVGNAFVTTLAKIYNLGAKQTNALGQCITEAYELKGISPGNPSTWDREAPTFNTVYDCYINNQEIKKTDSLASAMTKLFGFEIFEPDPKQTKSLFEVLNGVVVIDLSGYDTDIQNLIVAITLDLFYAQMFTEGSSKLDNRYRQLTRMILVDEADNFMSEGFPSLKKIMKEGREFGVGVILSTQFLKHFGTSEDDYSKYILTWVVHGVADLKERDVDFIFKTVAKSQESARLFNDVKALTKHHSIVKIGNNNPQYMKDFAFWEYLAEGAEKSDSTKD